MAPLGKRAGDSQGQSSVKRQRFIDDFLAGTLRGAVDASSDEEAPDEEVRGAPAPGKVEDHANAAGQLVETPKARLTPEPSSRKALTLPLRETPSRPLAEGQPRAQGRGPTPARIAIEIPTPSASQSAGRQTRRNATTDSTPQSQSRTPASRSLFQMWGQSPSVPAPTASPAVKTHPKSSDVEMGGLSEEGEAPEPKRRARQPARRTSGVRGAARGRQSTLNGVSVDESEADDEGWTKQNKNKMISELPPEVLRGLFTSLPGVKPKPGLNRKLPPLSTIEDIFDDLAKKAMRLGFEKFLDHLQARELKVATMFSGTESPLLALDMLKTSLQRVFGRTFKLHHMFSAEIEPFKQSYIQRNFSPELIFRDVNELVAEKAITAFGSEREVPTDIDLLVIGFPCVDFSNLNLHKKDIEGQGESGHTFFGVMRYCTRAKPPLIVVENVCSAPWDKLVTYWERIGYTAFHTKVDTKNYYLPQTRERGYMICVYTDILKDRKRRTADGPTLTQFSKMMKAFERPASSPITHFMLKETDPRFRIAVDDISSAPIKDRQAVDWTRYKARHLAYRMKEKLGDKRPLTKWTDNGACYPPDFYWRRWMQGQTQRVWDTLDSNYLRAFIRGYDMNFKSRFIDLSQGIDRELDTRAYGVAGCLTPRGQAFITSRGGPLLGIEALALQGIPIDKLLLSSESQRDLGDLAGNAMSSTVVGSAICCVLILYYHVLEQGSAVQAESEKAPEKEVPSVLEDQTMLVLPPKLTDDEKMSTIELHKAARRSAKICACESQSTTPNWHLFKCSKCEHTACSECGSNPPHQYVSLPREQITDRWMEFENHLQEVLPMRFEVQGLDRAMWDDLRPADMPTQAARSWDQFAAVLDEALSDELRFHSIARQTAWTVIYEGTHTRLELVFSQARVQWLLFVKSPATEPSNSPLRQILAQPIASMVPWDDDVLSGLWFVHSPVSSSFEIAIEGKGDTVPSYPAVLGLQHPTFKDTKVYSQITITATDAEMQNLEFDIRGDYELLQGCGAANGSLHKRIPTRSGELPLYFFLDPTEIGEADFDSWVFSLDHERLDTRQTRLTVAETMPGFSGITSQDFQVPVRCWSKKREACPDVRLATSAAVPTYQYPAQDIHVHGSTCKGSYVPFWVSAVPATRAESDFKADELQVADLAESPQMLQRFSWLLQRASTMTHFEDWVSVAVTPEMEQQCCALCSPQKPRILWTLGDKDQVQPYENPEDAAEYEQNIKQRPAPFLGYAKVDANGQLSLRICLNIVTLLHRARGKLCEGEGLTLQWRVCIDQMGFLHPRLNQLKEKSNDDDAESAQPPHFTRYFLRKEQLRSLTWMIAQESDDVEPFEEEEVAEALLPSINWRAEARATTKKYVRGGILGDEVGYGKTAISLALFDAQHEKDCREDRAKAVGAIPVKATLIVVPHHLVDQWRNEIQKFLGSTYRVLEIKNINSLANLSIRDMQNAHLVLVSATLFKGDKYYEKVSLFASPPGEPRGDGRIFTEWLKDAMEGIRAHVSCLMDEGADAVLDRIHDRTEELAASDIYRKYQPSKRLKGAKLQEYLENLREERRRNGGEEVDNYTAVQKIIEARKAREKEAARGTSEKHASRRDAVATRSSAAVKVKSEDEQQDGGAQRLERDTTAASAATQEVHHLEHGATDVVVSGVKNTDESSESAEPLPATTTAGSESVKNADSIGSVTKAEDTDDMDEAPRSRPVRARSVTHYVVSDDSEDEVKPPRRPARTSARNARRPSARSTRRAPVRRRAAREDESDEWVGSQDSSDDDDDFVDDMEAEESPQSEDDDDFSDSSIISSRPRKQKARQKRRKSPSSESDTPVKPKKAPAKRPAKKIVVKGIPTGDQVRSEARRAFSFNLAARDWRNLKNPLLHMFEFNRIIIDEFTYSKDRNFTATLAIPARKKWILSGTPPLNDFADVKSFSPFLDVALGEDDEDTSNRPENERLRVMQRERTDAEQFRPFVTRHSAAWHSRRHDVAQGFLDKFMRKNIPLFDEIPWTEHVCGVQLSPAERVSYLETYMQMMAANLQLKRQGDKEDDSREIRQLDLIMKESTSPEEVLIKLCSLSLDFGDANTHASLPSGAATIELRQEELKGLKADLATKLKQTRWLRSKIREEEEPNHFDNLIKTLRRQGWGDQEITAGLLELVDEMERDHRPSDGHQFYSTAEEKAANRHDFRPPMPVRQSKFMGELKVCTDDLRRIIIKIVARTRGIRLMRAVQSFHRVHAAEGTAPDKLPCDVCGAQCSLPDCVILGECGHISCHDCLARGQDEEHCQAPLCTGSTQSFRILRASDIGIDPGVRLTEEGLMERSSTHGSKMTALARLLKDSSRIPKSDRVILFIQFPEVMKAASDLLDEEGISHLVVTSNDHLASKKVLQFQSEVQDTRVLILQLGDVTAAGLNLQIANHIIFVSPLHAATRYDYLSGMTQAVGRARRYGQEKHVHIYHFLTLNTIEVNIFEERRQECIVRRDGSFLSVAEDEARPEEVCWSGKDLQETQLDKADE